MTNWLAALCGIRIAVFFLVIFGSGSVDAQFATAHPIYSEKTFLKGPAGETVSDVLFKNYGWTKLEIKPLNSKHGLDGVYVKSTSSGAIKDVLFVESKAEGAQLGYLISGAKQGSKAYIEEKLSQYKNEVLSGLPKNDPLVIEFEELQRAGSKLGYPSRVVRSVFEDGKWNVTMRPVTSPQPEEAILGEPTFETSIDLANPKKGIQKRLADGIAKNLKSGLENSGVSPERANAIVKEFNAGKIMGWEPIVAEVNKLPPAIDSIAQEFRAARVVRLPTPPSEIGQYAKAASKAALNVTKTEVVSGLLLADGRVVMTAAKVGAGAGLLSFAGDGGIATIKHVKGELLDSDYERELGYATIKGASVGTGVGVAVVLGATPAGWVVLAVGIGAYIVTDFAIHCYENKRNFSSLTIEDLKAFGIPVSNKGDFGIPTSKSLNVFK